MGMNDTPASERVHIAFFGCRNAGKSSLLNAVTGQSMAIVSDIKGTTTDPVYKTMELLPAGPVVIIDTPGLDDEGSLGEERVKKALEVLRKTDVAVLVIDSNVGLRAQDEEIKKLLEEKGIPYILALNKIDITDAGGENLSPDEKTAGAGAENLAQDGETARKVLQNNEGAHVFAGSSTALASNALRVSAVTGQGIWELKEKIAEIAKSTDKPRPIVSDLVNPLDFVVLVIPIDKAAPKGRLILPQQQVIRDLLDGGAVPVICRDSELEETLNKLQGKVSMVITDSQVFGRIAPLVPDEIPLTSFSILFSRYKGELELQLKGIAALDNLKDGDQILVSEGCTHHRQCGDIGTEKIPAVIGNYSGKKLNFSFTSGKSYPENLKDYKLVVHCGGCMLNEKEMKARIQLATEAGVPVTNYGMVLAEGSGILERSVKAITG